MTVYQLPAEVGAFTRYLGGVTARLAPGEGWYGAFASRDPEGLRACFDGTEIPPWDVVESLLQDLGESPRGPEAARARALHGAAAAAHDRRRGGADALRERLAATERARRYAEARVQELSGRLRGPLSATDAARLGDELAWARDDQARATSRVTEFGARLAGLGYGGAEARGETRGGNPAQEHGDHPAQERGGHPLQGYGERSAQAHEGHPAQAQAPQQDPSPPPPSPSPPPSPARRKPRGARYAWFDEAGEAGAVAEAVPVPLSVPDLPAAGAAPRGARFGGGAAAPAPAPRAAPREADADAARAAANAVYALRRLRAQGRGGEAHALLCEAVGGPPGRLPALAAELHRVGLGAEWATLLWEAASLPPGRLAAVAGALADAGRSEDCEQLLRQGVARPVGELAGACAALHAEGHDREVHALLTAFLRARTPEDAAQLAAADPHGLVPQLREAARALSPSCERDLHHALRVAGVTGS